ncbi:hypothetical protein D6783_00200 [Candidatus Woesearchaeota archaeon]|nr:MAG: hypothetical protein D6783_00200 [Candidatus Woesearchaeota archaeon]
MKKGFQQEFLSHSLSARASSSPQAPKTKKTSFLIQEGRFICKNIYKPRRGLRFKKKNAS